MISQTQKTPPKPLSIEMQNGYKRTDIGMIPNDWLCDSLESTCPKGRKYCIVDGPFGSNLKTEHYKTSGIPIISSGFVTDGYFNADKYLYVDEQKFRQEKRSAVNPGDIVMAKIGARCGASAILPSDHMVGILSGNALKITVDESKHTTYFIWQLLWNLHSIGRLEDIISTGAQPALSMASLKKFKLPLPPKHEQTAIANALSDVDALIQELEKLIAKKQAIKTATMQQLLTGSIRLPQFANHPDGRKKGYKPSELGEIPEDWGVLGFGSLFQPTVTKKSIKQNCLVTFVGMQDVTEQAQLVGQHVVSVEKVKSGFTYFERGDVLVAKITPCFENGKGCHTESLQTDIGFGSTEFHVLRTTDNSDSKFVYYWSTRDNFRHELESEMVGSAGHRRVPLTAIASYQIPIPPKAEQTAIATILFDMDGEIQSLEQRLGKTCQIKQGMMQELLTGKTRLI